MDNITSLFISLTIWLGISLFLIYINTRLNKLYNLIKLNIDNETEE